jgi:2-methylcitrate dehydratase PrpD
MSEGRLDDEALLRFCELVSVRHDPELDPLYPAHYPARLVVTGRDGSRADLLCEIAPGDAEEPLGSEVLRRKFVELAEHRLGDDAEGLARELDEPAGDVETLLTRVGARP